MTMPLTAAQAAEQARILSEGTGFAAYLFAREIPGADLKALEARVLAVGVGEHTYKFARDIPVADVAALHKRAQAVKFSYVNAQKRTAFDALLAQYQQSQCTEAPEAAPAPAPDGVDCVVSSEAVADIEVALIQQVNMDQKDD